MLRAGDIKTRFTEEELMWSPEVRRVGEKMYELPDGDTSANEDGSVRQDDLDSTL